MRLGTARGGKLMRAVTIFAAVFALQVLTGCAQIMAQQALKDARANFDKCVADNKASPEGQLLAPRLWAGDGTDTAAKL